MSSKIPKETIAELFELAKANDLLELSVTLPEGKFKIRRAGRSPVEIAAAEPAVLIQQKESAQPGREGLVQTCSPLMGIFYRAPGPGIDPFVIMGERVEIGDTLCIIEAMKVMNEIKAESTCKIVKILAENGRPVTAGQVLFQIEPA